MLKKRNSRKLRDKRRKNKEHRKSHIIAYNTTNQNKKIKYVASYDIRQKMGRAISTSPKHHMGRSLQQNIYNQFCGNHQEREITFTAQLCSPISLNHVTNGTDRENCALWSSLVVTPLDAVPCGMLTTQVRRSSPDPPAMHTHKRESTKQLSK